jgi:hypothetical protein
MSFQLIIALCFCPVVPTLCLEYLLNSGVEPDTKYSANVAIGDSAIHALGPDDRRLYEETLAKFHQSFEQTREIYGNCYLEGVTRIEARNSQNNVVNSGVRKYEKFKFWSRENRYFRIDWFDESDDLTGRLIVRPEGFVGFASEHGKLVVREVGQYAQGVDLLRENAFYCDAVNSMGTVGIERCFEPVIEGIKAFHVGNLPPNLSFKGNSSDGIFFFSVDHESGRFEGKIRDRTPFVLLDTSARTTKDGALIHDNSKILRYDPSLAGGKIPVEVDELYYGIKRSTQVYKIEAVPQPISIFSLEEHGFGTTWVWMRRIVILCIGLGLFGAYLAYRRKKRE